MNSLINTAFELAQNAHAGQLYGDQPYIFHLVRVALPFDDQNLRIIGLLHDIVEDTDVTAYQIDLVFGALIADAVRVLTRKVGEIYLDDYITGLNPNRYAREVKISDLSDHLYHIEHVYPGRYDSKKPRYLKAWKYLTGKEYPER